MSLMQTKVKARMTGVSARIPRPRQHQPRRRGRSYERMELPTKFHPTVDGLKTASEEEIASMLGCARLEFRYEPTTFTLGTGSAFKPDFYLPEPDVYLEVTEGNALRQLAKLKKIRRAGRLYGARIILIGPDELSALRDGDLTLWDVIHEPATA